MTATDDKLTTSDNFSLSATRYDAETTASARTTVVISPALGVPRRFYTSFAEYLAGQGIDVLTYDVRGVGQSRPQNMRGFQARMSDWGEKDMAAAFDAARQSWPGNKMIALGHSSGGQLLGLAPNASLIDAAVTVAAQSGWAGHWPGLKYLPRRIMFGFLCSVVMPGVSRLLGHFPGGRIGLFDIPGGVARQWSGWCMDPDYLFGDKSLDLGGYDAFAAPILAFSFTDDTYVSPWAPMSVVGRYGSASKTSRHVTPADVGSCGIGHFGFFKSADSGTLWAETADWIRSVPD